MTTIERYCVMIIAGILLILAAAGVGARFGIKLERQKWQAEKINLQKAKETELQTEFDRYARMVDFNNTKAQKATENHEKAVADLKSKYAVDVAAVKHAGGLRIPADVCSRKNSATTEAPGASGSHEALAPSIRLPARVEDDLFALTRRADEVVEQCRALQGWVRDNGFYGVAP